MKTFIDFSTQFWNCIAMVRGLIFGLLILIVVGAGLFALVEDVPFMDSLYFSFITALTVGYGDIVPKTHLGQLIGILIGVIGLIFFGVIIGISTRITIRLMHPDEFHRSER